MLPTGWRMAKRIGGGQRCVATVVDPPHIQHVASRCQIHNSEIEHDVRKATSGLRIPLDHVLKSFDQRCSAKLDMTFYDCATSHVHSSGSEQEERRRSQPERAVIS